MITKIIKTSVLIRIVGLLVTGLLIAGATLPSRVSAAEDSKTNDSTQDTSIGSKIDGLKPQTDPAVDDKKVCTRTDCPLITNYVNPAVKLLSALVAIVAVIAIVVGGIEVTTSAGDPQRSASGKNHIRNALIGIVAYVFFYAFLQWLIPGGLI